MALLAECSNAATASRETAAFAGVGTAGDAAAVNHADCCIPTDASAPTGP
jgi:hypothetical protein